MKLSNTTLDQLEKEFRNAIGKSRCLGENGERRKINPIMLSKTVDKLLTRAAELENISKPELVNAILFDECSWIIDSDKAQRNQSK